MSLSKRVEKAKRPEKPPAVKMSLTPVPGQMVAFVTWISVNWLSAEPSEVRTAFAFSTSPSISPSSVCSSSGVRPIRREAAASERLAHIVQRRLIIDLPPVVLQVVHPALNVLQRLVLACKRRRAAIY
jgi:hypothetical protein